MSAVVSHPDIPTQRLLTVLAIDSTLMTKTVKGRALQGVFYMVAPQSNDNPYPCLVVNQPITALTSQRMYGNGPHIVQASFLQDVRACALDVEPNDAELLAIRARVAELASQIAGNVTGGRANTCIIAGWTPDQRIDDGGPIYSEIGVTFRIMSSLT